MLSQNYLEPPIQLMRDDWVHLAAGLMSLQRLLDQAKVNGKWTADMSAYADYLQTLLEIIGPEGMDAYRRGTLSVLMLRDNVRRTLDPLVAPYFSTN